MKKTALRRWAMVACTGIALLGAECASASQYQITSTVNSWRIQSFSKTQIVLWYTGSICSNGGLFLPDTASADRNKLLAAMVISAKVAGAKMVMGYDVADGRCTISDFGMDGP